MRVTTKGKGVLKLVHAGRHVEYHRKAIRAEEIMRKNPRHSITRPDFFKNPDILVRPESLMVPGQVFYIVPNTTVHKLSKDRSQMFDRCSFLQDESQNMCNFSQDLKQTSRKHEGWSSYDKFVSKYEENGDLDDSLALTFQARDYYLNKTNSSWRLTSIYGQLQKRSYNKVENLKSCIKKYGNISTSSNRRVTFNFCTTTIPPDA